MHDKANVGLGLGLPSNVLCTKVHRPLTGLGIFIDCWFLEDEDDSDNDWMSPVTMPTRPIIPSPDLAPAPIPGTGEKVGLGIIVDCWFLGEGIDDEEFL